MHTRRALLAQQNQILQMQLEKYVPAVHCGGSTAPQHTLFCTALTVLLLLTQIFHV